VLPIHAREITQHNLSINNRKQPQKPVLFNRAYDCTNPQCREKKAVFVQKEVTLGMQEEEVGMVVQEEVLEEEQE
jgi:hypothetical protein